MSQHGPTVAHDDQPEEAHGEHHGGLAKYILVFLALCVLTTASFMTYTEVWREHFSAHAGWAFMMAVSCTKAMLVILFFMHLKYEANWKYVLTFPAACMSIFLILMLVPDVGMRRSHYSEERLRFTPTQADVNLYHGDEASAESPHQDH